MAHVAERFWSKVDASDGPESCWIWIAGRTSTGYGQFKINGASIGAYRWVIQELTNWSLEHEDHVCHKCDNPLCCNPSHLYIGSYATNIRDREERGRSGSGRTNAAKTHCPRGHEYTPENTLTRRNIRNCRMCNTLRERKRRAALRKGESHGLI